MNKVKNPHFINTTTVPKRSVFFDNPIGHIIILILVPFFIYVKTAGFGFINMDDAQLIYNHFNTLTHLSNIGVAFKTDIFLQSHGQFYSPVQTISFMLDAWISGERPWLYHLSNLIYHLLTVISLYSLLRFLGSKNLSAFIITLFFAIHPLLASAISWIPARADILIGLWGILLLLTFGKYVKSGNKIYITFHSLLFLLAVFTKEMAVLFPLLCLFYYFLIAKEKFEAKKLLPFFILWITIIICFFIMRDKITTGSLAQNTIDRISSLIDNLPAIPILLAKMFIPVNLSTMPLFENNFIMAGSLILVGFIVILIKKIKANQWLPVLGFIWFLVFLVSPLAHKLTDSKYILDYYQHWIYLPIIGIAIMLSFLLDDKLKEDAKSTFILSLLLIVVVIFISIATVHSDDFKNSIAFFSRAAELDNPGAATKRGQEYFNKRDFNNALNDFNNAVETSHGQYAPAYYYLGLTESQFNKHHDVAENDFTQAILLDSSTVDFYIERADERVYLQDVSGAVADLTKAKILDSTNPEIYYIEGKANVTTRNFTAAIVGFSKAISLDSIYTEAYNDRASVYYQLKKFPEAISDCNKTISLNNSFFSAYYNKGMVYYEMGEPNKAIKLFDTTLAIANNLYFGYFYRGMAKKQNNDITGACNDWQKSVNLGFTAAVDTIKKYCK